MNKLYVSLILLFAGTFSGVSAQPGTLDLTFNSTGRVDLALGTPYAITAQPDGRILVGGRGQGFTLARLNANGSVDTNFGDSGVAIAILGAGTVQSIALQSDLKILAAGFTNDFVVVRYKTDGSLDSSFSGDGIFTHNIASDAAYSVVVQPNGKILVSGTSGGNYTVFRLNADGTFDNSFGTGGIVTTDVTAGTDNGRTIALQTDGKIVMVGKASGKMGVVRYKANGSLDSTFGTNGVQTTQIENTADAWTVAIQPDGKIVAGGTAITGSNIYFAVARYTTAGIIDLTFSTDGIQTTAIGIDNFGTSLFIQPDSKIILAGTTGLGGKNDFAMIRFNTDGSLDNSFDTDGKVSYPTQTFIDGVAAVSMQPDGKIIASTVSYVGATDYYTVLRFISGVSVGIIDFTVQDQTILVYPNPVAQNTTLEYTLTQENTITVYLTDVLGKTIATFANNQLQQAGEQRLDIDFPQDIASGIYYIVIASPQGKVSVKVVK